MAKPAVTTPPGELIYMEISFLGFSGSKNRSCMQMEAAIGPSVGRAGPRRKPGGPCPQKISLTAASLVRRLRLLEKHLLGHLLLTRLGLFQDEIDDLVLENGRAQLGPRPPRLLVL